MSVSFQDTGVSHAYVLMRMRDGICVEGVGATHGEAVADATARWRQWCIGHPAPLAGKFRPGPKASRVYGRRH